MRNGIGVQLLNARVLDDISNHGYRTTNNVTMIVAAPKASVPRPSREDCANGDGLCVIESENLPLFSPVGASCNEINVGTGESTPTQKQSFTCKPLFPPEGLVVDCFFVLIIAILSLFYLVFFVGAEAQPGGHIFNLILVIAFCWLGGEITKLMHLHPFVGMLLAGFIMRNVPYIDLATGLNVSWTSSLRTIGLGICLTRAGLGVNPSMLQELGLVCGKLGFLPCVSETVIVAILSHFLLGFPWLWGFLVGSILSGVALAILVPTLLVVKYQLKLGLSQGIPTLIMTAGTLDNIVVLSTFGLFISVVFSNDGQLGHCLLHLLKDLGVGVVFSVLLGIVAWFIPANSQNHLVILRVIMLFSGVTFALFKAQSLGLFGASIVASVLYPFIASHGWRKRCSQAALDCVYDAYSALWVVFMPTLIGLSGAELKLQNLDANIADKAAIVVVSGLAVRFAVAMLTLLGTKLNCKERLFVSVTWLTKATIQGAFGSTALDFARKLNAGEDMEKLGSQVLTMTTMTILMTAPLGAAVIRLLAPRLLSKGNPPQITEP